jgi:trans-aconitate 2-methyltransferase
MSNAPLWDPQQYNRFEAERDRAALDLLLRLPGDLEPRTIVDLGCGTGQHAALLKRRHPGATVTGLDSSAAMLEQARALGADVDWVQADLASWTPDEAPDLIFANASLQWLPDHRALLRRLTGLLAPGGVIAVQMPLAWDTLHYRTMRAVMAEGPWAGRISDRETIQALLDPADYYDVLAEACEDVDVWSTTYLHALTGPEVVHHLSARPDGAGGGAGVDEGHGVAAPSDGAGWGAGYAGRLPFGAFRRPFEGVSASSGRGDPAAVSASVPDCAATRRRRRRPVTGPSSTVSSAAMAR